MIGQRIIAFGLGDPDPIATGKVVATDPETNRVEVNFGDGDVRWLPAGNCFVGIPEMLDFVRCLPDDVRHSPHLPAAMGEIDGYPLDKTGRQAAEVANYVRAIERDARLSDA
jgi:hypothetical protein